MSVLRPRTRLVNFRLSDEEFDAMERACHSSDARSISDFARTALLNTVAAVEQQSDFATDSIQHSNPLLRLNNSVGRLEYRIDQLLQLLDVLQKATPLEEQNVFQDPRPVPIAVLD